MAIEVEMPDTMDGGGTFLKEKGVYHLAVLDVSETPQKRDGSLIQNAEFGVDLEVLAGPQAKKQKDIVFFKTDPSKPKTGEGSGGNQLALRKIRAFLESTGVVAERVPGGNTYTCDPTKAKGRQLIAEFEFDSREGKEKNLQLAWANIWHIDDPSAPQCERNQEAIKLLPASLRRKPESFKAEKAASGAKSSGSNGNGQQSSGGQQQQKQSVVDALDEV